MANTTAVQLSDHLLSRFDLPVGFRHRPQLLPLMTGVAAVDRILAGGFRRGALNEISGPTSCNRTTLVISMLIRALEEGECCAWIDAGGTFDPETVSDAGVPLTRLLWINCQGDAEHALKATDLLVHGGGFGIVVIDLADVAEPMVRRISMTSWFRLRHAAEETGAALIAVTPSPQTRSCAAVCVELKRQKSLWRGELLSGVRALVEVRKSIRSTTASFDSVF
jgi:hypothetical protein